MSFEDVGMGEMHGLSDEELEAVIGGRTAGDSSEAVAFVGELRNVYASEAVPAPTPALTELFARGLPVNETAPVAATPRRNRVLAPFNRLGTAAKAVIAGVLLVGASTGLAAADLLPQAVDDTVSNVVPFVDSDDDDADEDDAAEVEDADDDNDDASDVDDDADDDAEGDDNSGPSENSGPGSVSSGSDADDDDDHDSDERTSTTIDDDDDTTATTVDDGDDDDSDDTTVTTIDDDDDDTTATTVDDHDSESDDSGSDDDHDNSGPGSDD